HQEGPAWAGPHRGGRARPSTPRPSRGEFPRVPLRSQGHPHRLSTTQIWRTTMRFIPTPGSFEAQSRWSQSSPPDHWGPSGCGPTLATPAEAWSRLTDQFRCAATEEIEARHLAHTCTVEECTGTEVIPYEYAPTGELHLDVMVAGWWWPQQHRRRDPHLMRL